MSFPVEDGKGSRIMIVDDECVSAELLANIVKKAGYQICITVTDPTLAVDRFTQLHPDLVLLDLHMEPISGVEVLNRINQILPPHSRPPVLVITADTAPEAKYEALTAGATDFLSKPLDYVEVTLRMKHLLRAHALFQQCQNYSQQLESLVEVRTAALQKQAHDLEQALEELKQTQQQVIQQERLRALGTMASGIAHDLNNGLTLILGHGDILLDDSELFPEESATRHHLQQIVRAGRDNATLVERLRNFYRPQASREERQPLDINAIIREAINVTAPRWKALATARGATIHIARDFDRVPPIAGSPAELREVFTNLIFNAVDAMPEGGSLHFTTRAEGDRIIAEISDTGQGMAPEAQQRCLEPFYTTKGAAGSGLGLAMSYGIIRRHGGSITFRSTMRVGTTFIISLPIGSESLTPLDPLPDEPIQHLSMLVVDDHPGICEIVSAYLAHDGHVVETATNGLEALAKFHHTKFDIVITDRAMPELNGNELAAEIKRIDPDEPIIMLTGFGDVVMEEGDPEAVDLVIHKPTCLRSLREAIHKVMRSHVATVPVVPEAPRGNGKSKRPSRGKLPA